MPWRRACVTATLPLLRVADLDATPDVPCEVCGAPAARWRNVADHDHFRCGDCRHLFVHPRPTRERLDDFYADPGYYATARREEARLAAEADGRASLLTQIASRLGLGRRLLDVGCATGVFLCAARAGGWSTTGVERSLATAALARERSGAPVYEGLIEEIDVPGAPFDVVTAWEVLEHASEPTSLMQALARNVVPGGLVALSTPRSDGIPARVMGERFPMICPPEHLSLFSRESLGRLSRSLNLEMLHYTSFSNLGPASLASGLSRRMLGRNVSENGATGRLLLGGMGFALAWIPWLVDRAGLGTEMLVVLRAPSA